MPTGAPNLVCTSYAAGALLDDYEQRQHPQSLATAISAAEYILDKLYWVGGDSACGFSYPQPGVESGRTTQSARGSLALPRLQTHRREEVPCSRHESCPLSAAKQQADGSWEYGDASSQRWIDNFHTGYKLGSLQQIDDCLETNEFESRIQRGFEFYKSHFIREDGAARYFHDKTFPIDIHCVAQSIITLLEFKHLDPGSVSLAHSVFEWAMKHMWDERGFFYYRVLRFGTIRTSYMRWSQAWMLLALCTMLRESELAATPLHSEHSPAFTKP